MVMVKFSSRIYILRRRSRNLVNHCIAAVIAAAVAVAAIVGIVFVDAAFIARRFEFLLVTTAFGIAAFGLYSCCRNGGADDNVAILEKRRIDAKARIWGRIILQQRWSGRFLRQFLLLLLLLLLLYPLL